MKERTVCVNFKAVAYCTSELCGKYSRLKVILEEKFPFCAYLVSSPHYSQYPGLKKVCDLLIYRCFYSHFHTANLCCVQVFDKE